MSDERRDRDLVLASGEFAYVLDITKGLVNVIVGPYKHSMSNTDFLVVWNPEKKRFDKVSDFDKGIQPFVLADEGSYVVLSNPSADPNTLHPSIGSGTIPRLLHGKRINMSGPVYVSLWPGQTAQVIAGHQLRFNQYLRARVWNDAAAMENWDQAVIKPAAIDNTPPDGEVEGETAKGKGKKEVKAEVKKDEKPKRLTLGQILIIKGNETSFYIPMTGIEVIKENDRYVQDAVTLERLEYCILLNENGNKRYVKGPDVVFPEPTEKFVVQKGTMKFRAIELNPNSGLYIKVIADYTEGGETFIAGQELFITGNEQSIYYPRDEHAIIKYGEQEIHFATVVPKGEARYVLNKDTGDVALVRGPKMLLPDPRREVIVQRILDEGQVSLWYPRNVEALAVNASLAKVAGMEPAPSRGPDYIDSGKVMKAALRQERTMLYSNAVAAESFGSVDDDSRGVLAMAAAAGEQIQRKQSYSAPRTLTLNTKYQGAVAINVWTGYAVLVVDKLGNRRVEVGPKTILLDYTESLQVMELSTGKPKTTDDMLRTVYLRHSFNKVSDIVSVETKDMCPIDIKLSYRVNFEGETATAKWFDVENYVKFLCDHLRSILKKIVREKGVEEFYANSTNIIRDALLGVSTEPGKPRPGRLFTENGMNLYDVEVLNVAVKNSSIASLMSESNTDAVKRSLEAAKSKMELEYQKIIESMKRELETEKNETIRQTIELNIQTLRKEQEKNIVSFEKDEQVRKNDVVLKQLQEDATDVVAKSELARQSSQSAHRLSQERVITELRMEEADGASKARIEEAKAYSPDLVAALQGLGDSIQVNAISQNLSPLAIIGGKSLTDVFNQLLTGTVLENALKKKDK